MEQFENGPIWALASTNSCPSQSTRRKFVVYVEGTLHPRISHLEIERDIMPTPQGWEGNDACL